MDATDCVAVISLEGFRMSRHSGDVEVGVIERKDGMPGEMASFRIGGSKAGEGGQEGEGETRRFHCGDYTTSERI